MKYRYVVRPRADDEEWYWEREPSSLTVHEDDDGPEDTGLLDARGNSLYRERVRYPMGFRPR